MKAGRNDFFLARAFTREAASRIATNDWQVKKTLAPFVESTPPETANTTLASCVTVNVLYPDFGCNIPIPPFGGCLSIQTTEPYSSLKKMS
ncbi:MAG: hypothetical protein JST12_08985 [Armatimonadetes bacterium]|nr:hypothetical protein [Armatimonadota bacterium]